MNQFEFVNSLCIFKAIDSVLYSTLFLVTLSDIMKPDDYLSDRRIAMDDHTEFPDFSGENTNESNSPDHGAVQQESLPSETPQISEPNQKHTVDQFFNKQPDYNMPPSPPPPAYPPFTPAQQPGRQPGQQSYQPPYNQAQYPPATPYSQNNYQQQYYYQPPYQPPYAPPKKSESGLAVASLVLSIVSFVLSFVPGLNIILALLAVILGIVAKVKGAGGMAIAGIIIGALSLVVSGIIIAFMVFVFSNAEEFGGYYDPNNDEWRTYTANMILRISHR